MVFLEAKGMPSLLSGPGEEGEDHFPVILYPREPPQSVVTVTRWQFDTARRLLSSAGATPGFLEYVHDHSRQAQEPSPANSTRGRTNFVIISFRFFLPIIGVVKSDGRSDFILAERPLGNCGTHARNQRKR